MSVIKSAVARYGRPQLFNFDNGRSYKNKQMELLAARMVLSFIMTSRILQHRRPRLSAGSVP